LTCPGRSIAPTATCLRPGGMYLVGLTGGIAAGKSLVSDQLRHLGAVVIDSDSVARKVVQPGSEGLLLVRQAFGDEFLDSCGRLDRQKLAQHVFAHPDARARLESILHPLIVEYTSEKLSRLQHEGVRLAFIDAPVLIEAGLHHEVDEIWVVAAPREVQLERLMARDGVSRDEAERRVGTQLPLDVKVALADHVITNAGSRSDTRDQVDDLYQQLQKDLRLDQPDWERT